jgi:hypothetical protein
MNDVRDLPVHDIVLDQRLIIRDHLDPETVERYGEVWDRLPPVAVFEVKKKWLLVDGFHRHAAAVQHKRTKIPAVITVGTFDEALDYAAGANLTHGLPLTRAERRRAVEIKLRLHPEWSDRQIAKELTVGRELIARVRTQLVESNQIPAVETRMGADGKVYPAPHLPKDPGERRPKGGVAVEGEAGRKGQAGFDDTVDALPTGEGVKSKVRPPWEDVPPVPGAKDLARSGPVPVAAPTIDEMLELMRRQIMEVISWIDAEGFAEQYPKASRHSRGLFHAAIRTLRERAERLGAA